MKEQVVTYEIAKKLKDLGFNEKCEFTSYCLKGLEFDETKNESWNLHIGRDEAGFYLPAPLWNQVIDWFREKHDIHINPIPYHETADHSNEITGYYCGEIYHTSGKLLYPGDDNFSTYYKAREFAIKKAIEIISKTI